MVGEYLKMITDYLGVTPEFLILAFILIFLIVILLHK